MANETVIWQNDSAPLRRFPDCIDCFWLKGHGFVDLLKDATDVKFSWDPRTEESFSEFKVKGKKHTVFYPSLSSIQSRLHLVNML